MCCVPELDSDHLDFRHQDDERTLKAEEDLEAAEGGTDKAAELASLTEEANLPMEELLKRYKMMASDNGNLEDESGLVSSSHEDNGTTTGRDMDMKDGDAIMVGNSHCINCLCRRTDFTQSILKSTLLNFYTILYSRV